MTEETKKTCLVGGGVGATTFTTVVTDCRGPLHCYWSRSCMLRSNKASDKLTEGFRVSFSMDQIGFDLLLIVKRTLFECTEQQQPNPTPTPTPPK